MHHKPKKVMLATLWIICLTSSLMMCLSIANNAAVPDNNEETPLVPMASTDKGDPQWMGDDVMTYDNYSSSLTTYYYQCYGISAKYSVVWLYTVSSSNDFNLYLYNDSDYSNSIENSTTTNQLDWIVYRPGLSTEDLYPAVYTSIGSGYAYIQHEMADNMNVNTGYPGSNYYIDYIELYQINLSTLTNYTVFLDVAAGSDYDLHVFRTTPGSAIRYDSHNSTSTSTGQYERIVFTPLYNDTYAIVVTQTSGGGAATLTVYDYIYVPTPNGIPVFELFPVLLALAAIVFLYLTSLKKNILLF